MWNILLTLTCFTFFVSEGNLIEKRTSQVSELTKALELDKKVEYSFEHLEGQTAFYTNSNHSVTRVFMKWDLGSYGQAEREYFTVDEKLIFYRNLDFGWVDSSLYDLTETIFYFDEDKSGVKTWQHMKTYGEHLKVSDLKKLANSIRDTAELTYADYNRVVDAFSHLKRQQLGQY